MAEPNRDSGTYYFSTDNFRAHERLEAWQEIFGRKVVGVDTTPLSDAPFRVDLTVRTLPGLTISLTIVAEMHSPLRMSRTSALLADGDDGVVLGVNATRCVSQQFGRETTLEPGDGICCRTPTSGRTTSRPLRACSPSACHGRGCCPICAMPTPP